MTYSVTASSVSRVDEVMAVDQALQALFDDAEERVQPGEVVRSARPAASAASPGGQVDRPTQGDLATRLDQSVLLTRSACRTTCWSVDHFSSASLLDVWDSVTAPAGRQRSPDA